MQNNRPSPEKPASPETPPQMPPPNWRKWLLPGALLLALMWVALTSGSWLGSGTDNSGVAVPFSAVRNQAADNIATITIDSSGVTARGDFKKVTTVTLADNTTTDVEHFTTTLPPGGAEVLQNILLEKNPDALIEASPPENDSLLLALLMQFLPVLLIILFFVWMSRRAQGQMTGVFGFGKSSAREYDAERPQVTFADVAGQDAAKGELLEIVDFLRNPEKYISLGARVPRGVLLVGPPGTGKTLMARAVAGEANCAFFSIAASEFVEMFVGVGASRVRDLFNRARENSPAIVFIDEIDAVGRHRGAGLGGGNDEREQTLNQMLSELDGFEQDETVIVMAATNRPDVLDPALLRPGRFDRQITVDLPDKKGRLDILRIHSRGKPLDATVHLEELARATVGFSGADLSNLANEAALSAARKNRKKISQADFTSAFERIILGTERPPLSNQEERRVVAYHEAGHALVAMLTPGGDQVLKITITPRGQALGITAFLPEDDRRNYSRRYLEAKIDGMLGGRIAEEIVFNDITTGASNDLRRVTDLARRMVSQFGMSSEIGPLNFGDNESQPFLGYTISQGRNYSEETAARIDAETRRVVEAAYERATALMVANRDKLDALANALLEKEIIERDEVLDLLGMGAKPLDDPEGSPAPDALPVMNTVDNHDNLPDSHPLS